MRETIMKNKIFISAVFMVLPLFAQINTDDFGVERDLRISGQEATKYFFADEQLYRYAQSDLDDLRIIDNAGNALAYIIEKEALHKVFEERSYELAQTHILRDKDSGKALAFDFQLLSTEKTAINTIKIFPDTDEYSFRVRVLSRSEKSNWVALTEDTVYRIDGFVKDTISLDAVCENKFFRIVPEDNSKPLAIGRIVCSYRETPEFRAYTRSKPAVFSETHNAGITLITVKNPDRLNVFALRFECRQRFKRNFSVFLEGNKDALLTKPLFRVSNAPGCAMDTELKMNSPVNDETIIIKVDNKEDSPLVFDSIHLQYRVDKIIFQPESGKKYRLVYGNPKARKPDYDISQFKTLIVNESMEKVQPDATVLEKKTPESFFQKLDSKVIFQILIGFTALVLSAIVLRVLIKKV